MDRKNVDSVKDYRINLQGSVASSGGTDVAPNPLFSDIKFNELKQKNPTIPAFVKLLDNYEPVLGVDEKITKEEREENRAFLDKVMETPIMRKTLSFLKAKGYPVKNEAEFKQLLNMLWLEPYRRRSRQDSSAFEHVFVGEERNNEVLGLHNWIQFSRLEKLGKLNYKGHFARICGHPPALISTSFDTPSGRSKPKGSMLIGTTPQFELALYTLAFLSDQERLPVRLGDCRATVLCHKLHNDKQIASCYVT